MRSRWVPRVIVSFIGVACLLATAMLTHLALARHLGDDPRYVEDDPLAPMFDVPHFVLTDQTGEAFDSDDLAGNVWVAHFFFSRCTTVCPMVTGQMAQLQMFLDDNHFDDVRMVSFTVDPENDTVEKLAGYADRLDVKPKRWAMLTGERDAIWGLVQGGFKLALEETGDPDQPVSHAASLVLVDGRGQIRAYYHDMNKPEEAKTNFARLVSDIAKLRREAR